MTRAVLLRDMICDIRAVNAVAFHGLAGLMEILHHDLPPPLRRRPTPAHLGRLCEGGTKISE